MSCSRVYRTTTSMHPYDIMKRIAEPILEQYGFKQVSEEYHPEVFGSAYSIFENGMIQIRLIWDGKDGWGYAQRSQISVSDWQDIKLFLTETDLEGGPMNDTKIDEFRIAISNGLKGEI